MSVKVQDCECGNLVQVGMKACPFCGRQRESEGVVVKEGLAIEIRNYLYSEAPPDPNSEATYRLTRIEEGEG